MEIGYIRYNFPTEIDYMNASSTMLGTDLRVPIINTLQRLGHHVTIYSKGKTQDEKILKTGKGEGFDYSNFKDVSYAPGEPVDAPFVIVEQAAAFTLASHRGKPYMEYVAEALRGYKGTILWYQHGRMNSRPEMLWNDNPPVPDRDAKNLKNIFHDMGVDRSQVKVWTHAQDRNAFVAHNKVFSGMPIITTPIGYDATFEPLMSPPTAPEYDFVYIGVNKGNRAEKLNRFFTGLPYTLLVIGKDWPIGKRGNVTFAGEIKGHGKIYELYRQGRYSLIIGDDEFEETGNQTTRFTQSITSGLFTFGDAKIRGIGSIVGQENVVRSKLGLLEAVRKAQFNSVRPQQTRLTKWDVILSKLVKALS